MASGSSPLAARFQERPVLPHCPRRPGAAKRSLGRDCPPSTPPSFSQTGRPHSASRRRPWCRGPRPPWSLQERYGPQAHRQAPPLRFLRDHLDAERLVQGGDQRVHDSSRPLAREQARPRTAGHGGARPFRMSAVPSQSVPTLGSPPSSSPDRTRQGTRRVEARSTPARTARALVPDGCSATPRIPSTAASVAKSGGATCARISIVAAVAAGPGPAPAAERPPPPGQQELDPPLRGPLHGEASRPPDDRRCGSGWQDRGTQRPAAHPVSAHPIEEQPGILLVLRCRGRSAARRSSVSFPLP